MVPSEDCRPLTQLLVGTTLTSATAIPRCCSSASKCVPIPFPTKISAIVSRSRVLQPANCANSLVISPAPLLQPVLLDPTFMQGLPSSHHSDYFDDRKSHSGTTARSSQNDLCADGPATLAMPCFFFVVACDLTQGQEAASQTLTTLRQTCPFTWCPSRLPVCKRQAELALRRSCLAQTKVPWA
jgi:hypothetical protein